MVDDLLAYIEASPSPFHCVGESSRRLDAAGYRRIAEHEPFSYVPGDRGYLIRGGGTLIAYACGQRPPKESGFRMLAAHTDSPNLRLKPSPARNDNGYLRADVEVYGGALLATWSDRDLGIAGRVMTDEGDGIAARLMRVDVPIARIPNVAIHLNRKVNEEGLKLDRHKDLGPTLGSMADDEEAFLTWLAAQVDVEPGRILGHELCFFDLQRPTVGGLNGDYIFSARLDNQASCHAALCALLARPEATEATAVVALFDHEEVGSGSRRGAAGPMLRHTLQRLSSVDALPQILARSWLVSADMAHAVHPARADLHDGVHLPRLNEGPVIKTHVGQRYATDAETGAFFRQICKQQEIAYQEFVIRQDLACGSTIGPISAADLGVRTVDVGNPMLSMHSVREQAGCADVAPMIAALSGVLVA